MRKIRHFIVSDEVCVELPVMRHVLTLFIITTYSCRYGDAIDSFVANRNNGVLLDAKVGKVYRNRHVCIERQQL